MSLSKDNSRHDKAIEGTLLTAEYIHQLQKSRSIVSQAENRAKKIIQAADKAADAAFQQALKDGYNQGITASLNFIGDYLCSLEMAKAHLVSTLKRDLSETLSKIVGSEEIITQQLTCWANRQTDKTIRLLIPASLEVQPHDLQEKLQQGNKNLTVGCHDDNTIIAESGDQIFCIDIARFHEKLINEYIYASASVDEKAEEVNQTMNKQYNALRSSLTPGEEDED